MKIASLTIDGYWNYGNVLQGYAIRKVLERYADHVDRLWHSQDNFAPDAYATAPKLQILKNTIKYLIDWRDHRRMVGLEIARQDKFRDFVDRYAPIRKDIMDWEAVGEEYDFFVTGSDQVWNPSWEDIATPADFLMFAPEEKRISYAASISTSEIPENRLAAFEAGIRGMHTLSVREQAGADLIERLTGRKAEVHCDPTLLLTAAEWRQVSRQPSWYHGQDYILTYFLGDRPESVEQVAKEAGLPVVNLLDRDVYEHYVTGVDEFIWAIEHASLLYTDSFHGTVFSILFRTPFVICNRVDAKDAAMGKMGSRIDTLLDYFGLQDRRGTEANHYRIPNPLDQPDWSRVEPVLEKERKRSADYFERVFGVKAKGNRT